MGDFGYGKQALLNLLADSITNTQINSAAGIAKTKLAALDIVNADVNASAGIVKTKLAALGIVNADVDAAAGIVKTKLAALGIVNADVDAAAGIVKTKLAALDIVNADVNASAGIVKTKLAALDIVNADVNASAGIVKTKLAALGIVNADVDSAAAIDYTKLTGVNPSMAKRKTGNLGTMNTTGISSGMFAGDITIVGTPTFSVSNFVGAFETWTTGTTSGNQAGVRSTGNRYRMDRNLILRVGFSIPTATLVKFFIGFCTANFPAGTGVTPLNAINGFGLYGETGLNANFNILHNDGGATAVSEALGTPIALDTALHTVEIKNVGTTFTLILDGTNTKNVTTDVPLTAQAMAMNVFVETRTGSARTMNLWHCEYEEGLVAA